MRVRDIKKFGVILNLYNVDYGPVEKIIKNINKDFSNKPMPEKVNIVYKIFDIMVYINKDDNGNIYISDLHIEKKDNSESSLIVKYIYNFSISRFINFIPFDKILDKNTYNNIRRALLIVPRYERNNFISELGENKTINTFKIRLKKFLEKRRYIYYPSSLDDKESESDFIKMTNWLFGTKFKTNIYDNILPENIHVDFYKIADVKNLKNNNRIALLVSSRKIPNTEVAYFTWGFSNNNYNGCKFALYIKNINDMYYNYIDTGGYIDVSNEFAIRYDVTYKIEKDLQPILVDFNKHLTNLTKSRLTVFDDITIKRAIKYNDRKKREYNNKINIKKLKKDKWHERLKKLDGGKILYFNDLEISKHSVRYRGQLIYSEHFNMGDILRSFGRYNNISDINFDEIFDTVVEIMDSTPEGNFIIGNVSLYIQKIYTHTVEGVRVGKTYINNIRINNKEVSDVLRRSLGYSSQEEFEEFLNTVNKCSLEITDKLNNGFTVFVHNFFDTVSIMFKIIRKKNINYIKTEDKEYRIKNSNALFNRDIIDINDLIEILSNPKIIKDLNTTEEINSVIKDGAKRYKDKISKENKLLKSVLKKYNIVEKETTDKNGKSLKGYFIKGANSSYILDYKSKNLNVYRYPSMKYICMVDKEANNKAGINALISRIYALKFDNTFSTKITTLGEIEEYD